MPLYQSTPANISWHYVNPDIPTGNTVASALVANTKTAFNSTATIPEEYCLLGGIANIEGRGMFTTGVTALGITVSIEMKGVVVASQAITLPVNLTNLPWAIYVNATILNSGLVEVQGFLSYHTSVSAAITLNIRNTASFNMSTIGGVPVTISVNWGTLALGGNFTLRQMIIDVV